MITRNFRMRGGWCRNKAREGSHLLLGGLKNNGNQVVLAADQKSPFAIKKIKIEWSVMFYWPSDKRPRSKLKSCRWAKEKDFRYEILANIQSIFFDRNFLVIHWIGREHRILSSRNGYKATLEEPSSFSHYFCAFIFIKAWYPVWRYKIFTCIHTGKI